MKKSQISYQGSSKSQRSLREFDFGQNEQFKAQNFIQFLNNKQQPDKQNDKETIKEQQEKINYQKVKKDEIKKQIKIDELIMRPEDKLYEDFYRQIIQMQSKFIFQDDVVTQSNHPSKQNKVVHTKITDFEQKLIRLIFENFPESQAREYYKFYEREQLKDTLMQIKKRSKDFDFVQKKLSTQNDYKLVTMDKRQEEYLLNKIQTETDLKVSKILKVSEDQFKYKKKCSEMEQYIKDRQAGKITPLQQLNELLKAQDQQLEEKALVTMFKESRLEDLNPSKCSINNKYNMLNFSKKQKKQEMLDNKAKEEINQQIVGLYIKGNPAAEKFTRQRQTFSNIVKQMAPLKDNFLISQQLLKSKTPTSRVQSQQSTRLESQQTQRLTDKEKEDLFKNKINHLRKNGHKKTAEKLIAQQLNQMNLQKIKDLQSKFDEIQNADVKKEYFNQIALQFDNDLEMLDLNEQQIDADMQLADPIFNQYKKTKIFRRKFVQSLVQNINNKSTIVSKYQDQIWADNFRKQLIAGIAE